MHFLNLSHLCIIKKKTIIIFATTKSILFQNISVTMPTLKEIKRAKEKVKEKTHKHKHQREPYLKTNQPPTTTPCKYTCLHTEKVVM